VVDAVIGRELKPFEVEARRPGIRSATERLREAVDSRELLAFLAWRDLTVRYKQSTIGVVWAVLQPLLLAALFTLFFGMLGGLDAGGVSYALATFVALLPWQLVSSGVFAASESVVRGQDLVKQVYFPRILIPLAPFAVALVDFCAAFAVALVWLVVASPQLTLAVALVPAFLLLALVTAVGVGCWLAALNVRFRDVQMAVPLFVRRASSPSNGALPTRLTRWSPQWTASVRPWSAAHSSSCQPLRSRSRLRWWSR
jgi:lipopolysaccharide transport system permease protein